MTSGYIKPIKQKVTSWKVDDNSYIVYIALKFKSKKNQKRCNFSSSNSRTRMEKIIKQNKWLIGHLCNFRCWDFSYNIELFADSLGKTGQYLDRYGNSVSAKRDGENALNTKRRLEKYELNDAYDKETWELISQHINKWWD